MVSIQGSRCWWTKNVQDAVEKAMREDYRSDMGGASSMAHDAALICGYHMSPNM